MSTLADSHSHQATETRPPKIKGGGQAVCLRGFSADQMAEASEWLRLNGYRVVRSMEAAQMVAAGPEAEKSLLDQAQMQGVKLVRWGKLVQWHEAVIGVREKTGDAACSPVALPIVERVDDNVVRVLGVTLQTQRTTAADAKLVPTAERFAHICMDQPFVDTLGAVLLGARGGYPVALEGETAASKTTAVLWLAHLLGQPVARLNLNGQTDAGELVGRHVPADALGDVQTQELMESSAILEPATRDLLKRAAAEGRGLTSLERALVARSERFPATQWRFQESFLPQALRRGWWLLLDEMNLAEPQILERLNSVLEVPTTLVLSEGDGTVFGPRGDVPVHKQFRMFATLNPSEYSGRSVLSPAFRDRWTVWHHAQVAGEPEIRAMLEFLVTGVQPMVVFHDAVYQGQSEKHPPAFHRWQAFSDVALLLQKLALFHTSVARAAGISGASGLAQYQRERLTFTRRTLLSVLGYVDAMLREGAAPGNGHALLKAAIDVFYINRMRDAGDRKAVQTMLRAAGLS